MDLNNPIINLAAIAALEEAKILAQQRGPRFHNYENPFTDLTDNQFKKFYRLTKPLASDLIDLLEPHIVTPTRLSALSVERKVLSALRFFAAGSYQADVGGHINHAMSQSSASRAIEEVANVLNMPQIFNQYVKMPQNFEELRATRNIFYERHNFPGVIGCVDCTHVAIFPPQINHELYPEVLYVNRKGYHSINVQLICDADLKIMNVCARFPGSTHDSHIWNNSNVLPYMQNLHNNNENSFYLLGDSGYALRPWLLTPITNAQPGTPEAAYNEAHRSTRSLIERCNGVLKLRFRCLLKHRVLHYTPEKSSKIINACTVLHNLCVANNVPPVQLGEDDGDGNLEVDYGMYNDGEIPENRGLAARANPDLVAGRQLRNRVVRNHFNF